ncbi:MAG: hypothetical protein JW999_06195, partial [Methanotrichaceae archaeon]|nr:hypothetical protein [Methanotrichaceae archaeon]
MLREEALLDENKLFQTREAKGLGTNHIEQSVSSDKYNTHNTIDSSGSFATSATIAASASSAGQNQNLAGSGDLMASMQATTGSSASSQLVGVANGALSTKQALAAGEGAYSNQNSALNGDAGYIESITSSPDNDVVVSGGFSGEGDLQADLSAVAAKSAAVSGSASILGLPTLDDDNLQTLSSGEMAMSVDAIYSNPKGKLGTLGLYAANNKKNPVGSESSNLLTAPVSTTTGGDADAYVLTGWRWNTKNPQLKFVLRNDAYLKSEGLTASNVQSAVTTAANTWDAATNQNLFADSNLVTISSTVAADKYNKINTINWKPLTSTCLAYSRTWYNYNLVDGYKTAVDSDLVFNTRYTWRTDGSSGGVDVQSVALHELGHTLGLGDLYGKTEFNDDTRQVMHYYTGIKRTL